MVERSAQAGPSSKMARNGDSESGADTDMSIRNFEIPRFSRAVIPCSWRAASNWERWWSRSIGALACMSAAPPLETERAIWRYCFNILTPS